MSSNWDPDNGNRVLGKERGSCNTSLEIIIPMKSNTHVLMYKHIYPIVSHKNEYKKAKEIHHSVNNSGDWIMDFSVFFLLYSLLNLPNFLQQVYNASHYSNILLNLKTYDKNPWEAAEESTNTEGILKNFLLMVVKKHLKSTTRKKEFKMVIQRMKLLTLVKLFRWPSFLIFDTPCNLATFWRISLKLSEGSKTDKRNLT